LRTGGEGYKNSSYYTEKHACLLIPFESQPKSLSKISDNALNRLNNGVDKSPMKKGVIAFSLLIALVCNLCRANDLIGEKAPEIKIREWVTDNPPDLQSLDGRVRVLDFWATWCSPCVSNIPHLIKLCSKYKPMGVEFIALSQDKSPDKVRKLTREKGVIYDVAIDNGTVDWFKVKCYPTVVVISHTDKVIWRGFPWESGFELAITEAIAKAPAPLLQDVNPEPFTMLQMIAIINQRIFDMYADIVTKYGSIEAAEPAKAAYLEFKNYPDSRELLSEFPFSYDWLIRPVTSMQESRQY
jgi:thiol-disulfide isomerase/thioredoxin